MKFNKKKLFLFSGGLVSLVVATSGLAYILAKSKEEKKLTFKEFSPIQKLYNLSMYHNLDYKYGPSTSMDWRFFNFKRDNIINKKASDIKNIDDIDDIIEFDSNDLYQKYYVYGVEAFDEIGHLIIYLIDKKDWNGEEITDFSNIKLENVQIENFKEEKIPDVPVSIKTEKEIDNSVGLKILNSNNEMMTGNARFINYLTPENQGEYPTKWFLLSAGHLFFEQMDQEEFDLTLFHTNLEDKTVKAKVIQDGRDQWNFSAEVFKKFLPREYRDKKLHTYLDYAIIEVNFQTEEDAKKWTSIDPENDIFSDLYKNNFYTSSGYFDLENGENVFKYINTENKWLYLFDSVRFNLRIDNSTHFFANDQIINSNGAYYVDLSTSIMPSGTKFQEGSSGVVEKINSIPNIKIAFNEKSGLWMPTKIVEEFDFFKDVFSSKIKDNAGTYLMSNFKYDIFNYNEKLNQSKSFDKTFEKLYPNKKLGFNMQKHSY
ncbi:hypothetical protein [Mycoplasmopsis gallinacea]|uniref:DUF31 domain-containing protein n=1 Tax=Mycoplasmopsis gallinacea TaxID=29556 RepID=A0A6H0V1W6_9BACT|nr:hypothetical protein [Mycoplasmopsis gallinacea]QIW61968.1 hypothetical protein GOQ20_00575 [Mycoplasmopsis gallinacea]